MKMKNCNWIFFFTSIVFIFFVNKRVFKLQKQIYRKSKRNDIEGVHRLQKIMIDLPEAKLLAVRRITQDNRGKNTPGIDGINSLTPTQREKLVESLYLDGKTDRIKRIYIPKSTPGGK